MNFSKLTLASFLAQAAFFNLVGTNKALCSAATVLEQKEEGTLQDGDFSNKNSNLRVRKLQSSFTQPSLWVNNFGYNAGEWRVNMHPRHLADVNGDGKADIVGFGDAATYVSLSTGQGFTQPSIWVNDFGYNQGWRNDEHPRHLADVNGDGKADIVGFDGAGAYVSLSTGQGFTQPSLWVNTFGYNQGWRNDKHPRHLVDVNGDGKADIVGFGNAGAYVSLSTGQGFAQPSLWVNNFGYNGGWRVNMHPRYIVDVNDDGKADIVGFGNAGPYVSLSTGQGFAQPSLWVNNFGYNAGGWRVNMHPRHLVDVNGDGKADIVGFGYAGAYVSLSTGQNFTQPSLWVNDFGYNQGWRNDEHPRHLADVNGDGKADIVGFDEAGTYVSLATGQTFTQPSLWVNDFGYNQGWRNDEHPRHLVDVNGDGKADIVGFGNAGAYVSLA